MGAPRWDTFVARFWSKVRKSPEPDGCWVWTGSVSVGKWQGYGFIQWHGRKLLAHRFSYELAHGPGSIGELCVLHRCDNPPCVRPDHLFRGTRADNNEDKVSKGRARGPRKTHCLRGHELSAENSGRMKGGRYCRECRRQQHRRWLAAQRAGASV